MTGVRTVGKSCFFLHSGAWTWLYRLKHYIPMPTNLFSTQLLWESWSQSSSNSHKNILLPSILRSSQQDDNFRFIQHPPLKWFCRTLWPQKA